MLLHWFRGPVLALVLITTMPFSVLSAVWYQVIVNLLHDFWPDTSKTYYYIAIFGTVFIILIIAHRIAVILIRSFFGDLDDVPKDEVVEKASFSIFALSLISVTNLLTLFGVSWILSHIIGGKYYDIVELTLILVMCMAFSGPLFIIAIEKLPK